MLFSNIFGCSLVIYLAAIATNVKAPCPTDNWYQIPTISKTCFHYDFTAPRFWSAAKTYCSGFTSEDGAKTPAHLVEPSTAALQQAIAAYAALLGSGKDIWTGGNDQGSEGTWAWDNGSKSLYDCIISYIFCD